MNAEQACRDAAGFAAATVARFKGGGFFPGGGGNGGSLSAGGIMLDPLSATAGSFGRNEPAYEQLRHFRGFAYNSIRVIAQTIAALPIMVARDKNKYGIPPKPEKRVKCVDLPLCFGGAPPGMRTTKAYANNLEQLDSHPILELFNQPNGIMTQWHLMYMVVASLELTGKAYLWLTKEKKERRIWPFPTSWVTPLHENGKPFSGWCVQPGGMATPVDLPPEEIIYFYYPDPNDPKGATSPMLAGGRAVAADEAIQECQARAFLNGIWPGMAIIVGDVTDEDGEGGAPLLEDAQRQQIHAKVRQLYSGVQHFNEPLILDALIKDVKELGRSNKEMDFLNSSADVYKRITQTYGTPPYVLGSAEPGSRAASAISRAHFGEFTLNPKVEMMSQVLTRTIGVIMAAKGENLKVWIRPYRPDDDEGRRDDLKVLISGQSIKKKELRSQFQYMQLEELDDEDGEAWATAAQPGQPGQQDGQDGNGNGTPQLPPGKEQAKLPPPDKPDKEGDDEDDEEDTDKESASGKKPGKSLVPVARGFPENTTKALGSVENDFPPRGHDGQDYRTKEARVGLWLKAHGKHEKRLAPVVKSLFEEQRAEVKKNLTELLDHDAHPTAAQFGRLLDADHWTDVFKARLRPMLATIMVEGALRELATAKWIVAANIGRKDESDEIEELLELPEDVRAAVMEQLESIVSRPYWEAMQTTTKEKLRDALVEGVDAGEPLHALMVRIGVAPTVEGVYDGALGDQSNTVRASNIARTETTRCLSAGQQVQLESLHEDGLVEAKEFWAIIDGYTRNSHQQAHGQIVPVKEPFILIDDDGTEYEAMYPGDPNLPASEVCNCILPGATVAGRVNTALRSFYNGEAVEIVTRSGRRLAVTPNHPVMTEHGLVAAGTLNRGEQVVSANGKVDDALIGMLPPGDHEYYVPAKIEKIFEAFLSCAGSGTWPGVESRGVLANDFHGDGDSIQGDVEIVRADRELLENIKTSSQEKRSGLVLVTELSDLAAKASHGDLALSLLGRDVPSEAITDSLPERGHKGGIGLAFNPGVLDRLRHISGLYLSFTESPEDEVYGDTELGSDSTRRIPVSVGGNNSGIVNDSPVPFERESTVAQPLVNRDVGASVLARHLLDRHPGLISLDEVRSIRKFHFSGHVYDLQSPDELIVTNGIVTHNCRCTVLGVHTTKTYAHAIYVEKGNPNHDSQGRFASGDGGTAHSPNMEPDKFDAEELTATADIAAHIEGIAKKLGYPAERVHVHEGSGQEFKVGGRVFSEGGYCDQKTGEVHIYMDNNAMSVDFATAIGTHEITHGMFEKTYLAYKSEAARVPAKGWDKEGNLKPELAKKYPLVAKLHPLIGTEKARTKLANEDGTTDYSTAWWNSMWTGDATIHQAIHETLACMAEVATGTAKMAVVKEPGPSFKKLMLAVKGQYKKLPKGQKGTEPTKPSDEPGRFKKSVMYFDKNWMVSLYETAEFMRWWNEFGDNGFARVKGLEIAGAVKKDVQSVPTIARGEESEIEFTLLDTYGPISVYLVNGEQIRDLGPEYEEFNESATHDLLPHVVPENEIWIEDTVPEDEWQFVIDGSLWALATGDYDAGVRREKAERERAGFHGEPLKDLDISSAFVGLAGYVDGHPVRIVDAEIVRDLTKTDWAIGGNWLADKFIPKGEFWLDYRTHLDEQWLVLMHEYLEVGDMGRGLDYEHAHARASHAEWECRETYDVPAWWAKKIERLDFTNRIVPAVGAKRFNADQPRDDHGRFSETEGRTDAQAEADHGRFSETGGGAVSVSHWTENTRTETELLAEDPHETVWKDADKTRSRYGMLVIDPAENKILLREPTNHFEGFSWTYSRGGREGDEHPLETAKREGGEELGLDFQVLNAVPHVFRGSSRWASLYYIATQKGEPHEHDWETASTKWATYEEAKSLIGESENAPGRKRDLEVLDVVFGKGRAGKKSHDVSDQPRDHGKFAEKPGASGEEAAGAKPEPDPSDSTAGLSWDHLKKTITAHMGQWIEGSWWVDRNSPDVEKYKKAVDSVTNYMTPRAMERFIINVKEAEFYPSIGKLTIEVNNISGRPSKGSLGGAWTHKTGDRIGKLHLDGGAETGENAPSVRELYAHEFAHAVDGERSVETINGVTHEGSKFISDSEPWKSAWESEIKGGALSDYATTRPDEGFAEFGRLAWQTPRQARDEFPKCWAVWEKHGLVESAKRKEA